MIYKDKDRTQWFRAFAFFPQPLGDDTWVWFGFYEWRTDPENNSSSCTAYRYRLPGSNDFGYLSREFTAGM